MVFVPPGAGTSAGLLPPPPAAAPTNAPAIPLWSPGALQPRTPTPPPAGRAHHPPAPTTDDADIIAKCRGLFSEARSQRAPLVNKWNRWYRAIRNRTWIGQNAYYPTPEVPEMLPIIESLIGWLTDTRPTFDVMPSAMMGTSASDYFSSLGDDLRVALSVNWTENDSEAQTELVARDAYWYGMGIFKTIWDNTLVDGLGDATSMRLDPYSFYPDPAATSFEDANYFIEARRMSIQEVDRRFPGAAAKLITSRYSENMDERPNLDTYTSAPKANPGAIYPRTSVPSYSLPGQSRESIYRDPQGVTMLECWLREHRVSGSDTDPADPLTVHDEWRCIIICGPFIFLNERASDLFEHGKHPYDRFVATETGEMWGISLIELLLPSQVAINRLLGSLQHNVELTGNPVLVESQRAGIQRTQITNRPGQRLKVNDGGQVQWLVPPRLPPEYMQLITSYIGEMERISGLTAINRGTGPGGRNAASVVESLQEASFVRVRMTSRQLERSLRNVGEKRASLIAQYYTEPRLVSLLGDSGERTSRAFASRHFYVPGPDGSLPMRFQLQVQAGSALPTSRQARMAEIDSLYAQHAVDLYTVLQIHNIPNYQQVYQRTMAENQAMASAQATQREMSRA